MRRSSRSRCDQRSLELDSQSKHHPIRLIISFAASFLIYCIPVFTVHAVFVLGAAMFATFGEPIGTLQLAYLATALAMQALTMFGIYWALKNPNWRRVLVLIVCAPCLVIATNLLFLWFIPILVLVESDTAVDSGKLDVVCSLPETELAAVQSGSELDLERRGETWITQSPERNFALLSMPGCKVISLPGTRAGSTFAKVAAGGHILYRAGANDSDQRIYYAAVTAGELIELAPPADVKYWDPILSTNGSAVAWIRGHTDIDGVFSQRMHLRDIDSGTERNIDLKQRRGASLSPLSVDIDSGEYLLSIYRNEFVAVNENGDTVWGPLQPNGTYSPAKNLRRIPNGWVAWDAYRDDDERARIVWSLNGAVRVREVPKGRGISSVAVHPDGRFIAVSTGPVVNLGDIGDSVFILNTADGRDVFRRQLPAYSRVRLAFVGSDHLAMAPSPMNRSVLDVVKFTAE